MDTDFNSPISDSEHHNKVPDGVRKQNSSKLVLIVVALMVFLMGLGAVFFLAASEEPAETMVTPTENY